MITINDFVEQSLLMIMWRYKQNFTFVTKVSGNLDTLIEVMGILLMELVQEAQQSIQFQTTVWNISYRMPAPHYVVVCVYLSCWVNNDKVVHRNEIHAMYQTLAE